MFFIKKVQTVEITHIDYVYKDEQISKTEQLFNSLLKYKNNQDVYNDYDIFLGFTFENKTVKIKSNLTNLDIGSKIIVEKVKDDYFIKDIV